MDGIKFLDTIGIKWIPISLKFSHTGEIMNGEEKIKKELQFDKVTHYMPKYTDMKTMTSGELKYRQSQVNNEFYNAIWIDTTNVYQIDIDSPVLDKINLDEYKSKLPYYKSVSKSYGYHFFIKPSNVSSDKVKLDLVDGGELLKGQGAYALKDFLVQNGELSYTHDLDLSIIKQDEPKAEVPKAEVKVEMPKTETKSKKKAIVDEDLLETHVKLFIRDCLSADRADEYATWRDTLWSIISTFKDDNEKMFKYCKLFSMKSSKYNEEELIKKIKILKNNSKFSSRSLYFWAKHDNLKKYKKILSQFPLLQINNFNEGQLAKLFYKLNKDNYIYNAEDKQYYSWTGTHWLKDDESMIYEIQTGSFYDLIKTTFYDSIEITDEDFKKIYTNLKYLGKRSTAEQISKSCRSLFRKQIDFDVNKNLLGFNNGVYDLKNHEFRDYERNDFVTFSCGYNYKETNDFTELDKLLDSILPNPELKNLMLQLYCSSLFGQCLEKFIMINGCGGNGKGLLKELISLTLGDYFTTGNTSILTSDVKGGANPELVALAKKRLVIFSEPSASTRLNNGTIKALTGGDDITARGHYSSKVKHKNFLTLMVECNQRPNFEGNITEGEYRRFIDVLFPNKFTTDENEIDNITVFRADPQYKDKTFLQKLRLPFINKLLQFIKNHKSDIFNVQVPEYLVDRANDHLESSEPIIDYLKENYELTDNQNEFIKFDELYKNFKSSDSFHTLTNKEKRDLTAKKCKEIIQRNRFSRNYYFNRKCISGKDQRCILTNFKLREDEDTETNDLDI